MGKGYKPYVADPEEIKAKHASQQVQKRSLLDQAYDYITGPADNLFKRRDAANTEAGKAAEEAMKVHKAKK